MQIVLNSSLASSILGKAYVIVAVPSTEAGTFIFYTEYILVFVKDGDKAVFHLRKCFYNDVTDDYMDYDAVVADLLDTAQMEANVMVARALGVEWHKLQEAGLPYAFSPSTFADFEQSLRRGAQKPDFRFALGEIHSKEMTKILIDVLVRTGILEPDPRSNVIEISGETV
jgi:hypothetical protein